MGDNRPSHTISYGAIRITVWSNQAENGVFYDVVPARIYRNDEGQWRDSHSFAESDLPLLAKALWDAHSWIQTYKSIPDQHASLPLIPKSSLVEN